MNIKFGMDNFYVRYLKRFLNQELSESTTILGKFNRTDLALLIKYLNLPNVKNMFEVQKEIISLFPELDNLFYIKLQDNYITWTSKIISETESEFLTQNIDKIREYCKSVGWELENVSEWIDLSKDINNDGKIDNEDRQLLHDIIYSTQSQPPEIVERADLNLDGVVDGKDLNILDNYLNSGKLTLTIKKSNRKNYFPNKDMLVFVNQFEGVFLYDYALRNGDASEVTDKPHPDITHLHKIALYACQPGQKVTIAHNNTNTSHLVIGCSTSVLKQDITTEILQNVVEIDLRPGEGYQYECTSKENGTGYDAHWLCIECPSDYGNLSGDTEVTTELERGDINFDGEINLQDYHLLASYTATGPGSEDYHWEPTEKQKLVMDINSDGKIDNEDAEILYHFVIGDSPYVDLGVVPYTYNTPSEYTQGNNVNNLLIIDGHYDNSVNIPFSEFVTDDWVIHEKFFNYLLGMAIHIYSDSENITYLQKLLKEYYPQHLFDKKFFYPGLYSDNMKKIVTDYQKSKVSYSVGDLNKDGKIDNTDLQLLRSYLDNSGSLTPTQKEKADINGDGKIDSSDLQLLRNYLDGSTQLTPEQEKKADINGDGNIDENDYTLLENYLQGSFSPIQMIRADVNKDGYIDENDYEMLERQVNGEIHTLDNYDISFILGWCDVQTESLIESEFNIDGRISEVSK